MCQYEGSVTSSRTEQWKHWRQSGLVETQWPIILATEVNRIPVRAVHRKRVRVSEVNYYLLPPIPMPNTGVYKRDWRRRANYLFALFPVTRHNKELVEAQPWTNRSITHPPAFTTHMYSDAENSRSACQHILRCTKFDLIHLCIIVTMF